MSPEGIFLDPITLIRPATHNIGHPIASKRQHPVVGGDAKIPPTSTVSIDPKLAESIESAQKLTRIDRDSIMTVVVMKRGGYKKSGNGERDTIEENSLTHLTERSSLRDSQNIRKKMHTRMALTLAAIALVAGAGVVGYLASTLWMRNRTVNPYGYGYGGYGGYGW